MSESADMPRPGVKGKKKAGNPRNEARRMVSELSKMKFSEMIAFAEEQAAIEAANPPEPDPDRDASWAATLELLRLMKERGIPEALKDSVDPQTP